MMPLNALGLEIERRLTRVFAPLTLDTQDESHLHAGHAGSVGGGQHFAVTMRSAVFQGLSAVKRHQAVYAVLGDLMLAMPTREQGYIHALKLQLSA